MQKLGPSKAGGGGGADLVNGDEAHGRAMGMTAHEPAISELETVAAQTENTKLRTIGVATSIRLVADQLLTGPD